MRPHVKLNLIAILDESVGSHCLSSSVLEGSEQPDGPTCSLYST